jgi:hypothetical protein
MDQINNRELMPDLSASAGPTVGLKMNNLFLNRWLKHNGNSLDFNISQSLYSQVGIPTDSINFHLLQMVV